MSVYDPLLTRDLCPPSPRLRSVLEMEMDALGVDRVFPVYTNPTRDMTKCYLIRVECMHCGSYNVRELEIPRVRVCDHCGTRHVIVQEAITEYVKDLPIPWFSKLRGNYLSPRNWTYNANSPARREE